MIPLKELPEPQCRAIRAVFTDIDDTLTTEGTLTADAYSAMSDLYAAGIYVVPITGRPAGWCDLIARIWPVSGVVGENGAFYFQYNRALNSMHRFYADSEEVRADKRARLSSIGEKILSAIPGAALSADQAYRETDLAIDISEDVPELPRNEVDRVVALFHDNGATAKISSIHVNGWIGQYDKLSMTRTFASNCLEINLETHGDQCVFVGDSPNDAPMFEFFSHSIGVANIHSYVDRMPVPPKYVTAAPGGAGFVEVAQAILTIRKKPG